MDKWTSVLACLLFFDSYYCVCTDFGLHFPIFLFLFRCSTLRWQKRRKEICSKNKSRHARGEKDILQENWNWNIVVNRKCFRCGNRELICRSSEERSRFCHAATSSSSCTLLSFSSNCKFLLWWKIIIIFVVELLQFFRWHFIVWCAKSLVLPKTVFTAAFPSRTQLQNRRVHIESGSFPCHDVFVCTLYTRALSITENNFRLLRLQTAHSIVLHSIQAAVPCIFLNMFAVQIEFTVFVFLVKMKCTIRHIVLRMWLMHRTELHEFPKKNS